MGGCIGSIGDKGDINIKGGTEREGFRVTIDDRGNICGIYVLEVSTISASDAGRTAVANSGVAM